MNTLLQNIALWFALIMSSTFIQIFFINDAVLLYQGDVGPDTPGAILLERCGQKGVVVRGGYCVHVLVYHVMKNVIIISLIMILVGALYKIYLYHTKQPTTQLEPIRRRIRRNQRQRERQRERQMEIEFQRQRQRDWMKTAKVFLTWISTSVWEIFDANVESYIYDNAVDLGTFDRWPTDDNLRIEPTAPPLPLLTFPTAEPPKRHRKSSKKHRPQVNN